MKADRAARVRDVLEPRCGRTRIVGNTAALTRVGASATSGLTLRWDGRPTPRLMSWCEISKINPSGIVPVLSRRASCKSSRCSTFHPREYAQPALPDAFH